MKVDRLTDVNPLRTLFLNEKDLNNYVFRTKRVEIEADKNYDVALVLGCSIYDVMKHRAIDAKKLYDNGTVQKLILTGGIGRFSKNREDSEANVMKRFMLENGVSENDIIVEDKSRDTLENMRNSLGYIQKECGDKGKIVLVTSDFHCKRAKGMLQLMTPLNISAYGSLDGKHDIDKWNHTSFSEKKMLHIEALCLSMYARKGVIPNFEIEEVNGISR